MPHVSPEEAARLAALSRIELSPDEAERLAVDLESILAHVASLEAAEAGVGGHAAAERSVFRDDARAVRVGTGAKDAFPESEGPFLAVPRVF